MTAGEELAAPDFSYHPDSTLRVEVKAGTIMTRSYSYTGKYAGNSYNTRQISAAENTPSFRARYSSVETFMNPFGILYASTYSGSDAVVVLETIDHRTALLPAPGKPRILRRGEVSGLAVAYFEVTRDISLIDFTTRPHCRDWYGADQDVLEGNDQAATREWAHWVRSNAVDADGILYRSKKYGSEAAGWPAALIGSRHPSTCSFLRPYDEVRLDEKGGYKLLSEAARETGLMPESPWM